MPPATTNAPAPTLSTSLPLTWSTPLVDPPCTPAALGNRSFSGDGRTGTTAITTQQWLSDKASFSRSKILDDQGDFVLYWNVSMDADGHNGVIRFAAEVATDGWFGVGISASGAMIDADSVIGWVHTMAEGGQQVSVDMTDRYNVKYGQPPIDASQDVYDVVGVQDMMDAIIPPPNPIYYNFTNGAAPCHHGCVVDESSSSSSSSSTAAAPTAQTAQTSRSTAQTGQTSLMPPTSTFTTTSSITATADIARSSSSSTSAPFIESSSSSSIGCPWWICSSTAESQSSSSSSSSTSSSSSSSSSGESSSSSSGGSSGGVSPVASRSEGLSGGAVAGIVIGSVAGGFLMAAIVFALLWSGCLGKSRGASSSQEDVSLSGLGGTSSAAERRRNRDQMRHGLLAGERSTLV